MSVYTPLSIEQILDLMQYYPVGDVKSYSGIVAGTVNSNFLIQTDNGHYVLTLFETLSQLQVRPYLNLMIFLAEQQIPCPAPIRSVDNQLVLEVESKPAVLFPKVEGQTLEKVAPAHCQQVGEMMARFHIASQQYPNKLANLFGEQWHFQTIEALSNHISTEQFVLIEQECKFHETHSLHRLPHGIVHADIFRDNVLFDANQLSGIIDYYFSCHEILLYDLAILINDWCFDKEELSTPKLTALLSSYHNIRQFTAAELGNLSVVCRKVSLRYWLSRLISKAKLSTSTNQQISIKDPTEYEHKLRYHQKNASTLLALANQIAG